MSQLHDLVTEGDVFALKHAIAANADNLDVKNDEGYTPIVLAASLGREDMVEALAIAGANVLQESPEGLSIKSLLERSLSNRQSYGEYRNLSTLAEESMLYSLLEEPHKDNP